MELNKNKWNKEDIENFNIYLESLKKEDKIEFTKRIVNTKMDVLGIKIPTLRDISKDILKGNYQSYLDLKNNKFYENTIINVCIINKIKNFDLKKHYLSELYIDNWSTCDTLTFNIKGQEEAYFNLSKEYLKNDDPFIRRLGIRILFSFKNTQYVDKLFKIIDNFYDEDEYYVNMAIAWLLCELMIYNRNKTLKYLENHHLNKFVINKMISKCRDSYRISQEDKDFLVKYRIK